MMQTHMPSEGHPGEWSGHLDPFLFIQNWCEWGCDVLFSKQAFLLCFTGRDFYNPPFLNRYIVKSLTLIFSNHSPSFLTSGNL